jgi:hypothetical protein
MKKNSIIKIRLAKNKKYLIRFELKLFNFFGEKNHAKYNLCIFFTYSNDIM